MLSGWELWGGPAGAGWGLGPPRRRQQQHLSELRAPPRPLPLPPGGLEVSDPRPSESLQFGLGLGLGHRLGPGLGFQNSLGDGAPGRRSPGPGAHPPDARRPGHLQVRPARTTQLYALQLLGTELPDKGCQEEPVVLADVPAEAFLTVLEFLYTNSITLDRRTVLEVMISSLEYGLSELRELCVEFVVQNLDVELVCEALQVAVTFGLRLLRDRCLNFIDCHAQDVLRTPAFHELSAAALVPVLRSDRLAVDEVELIAATRHWARVSSAVLEQPMVEVAQSVVGELRLPLLNASELSTLEEQNRVEPFIPVEQIAEAWKCHALRGGESIRTSSSLGRRRKGTTPREHHYYLESS
ncbi:BTB/POZ domain-containing protein 19 isoform X6 [Monodelphis domestica]|uniref:BTB/POZ domain-containing protein 19 isoform X6 n=1 Tax=Monodelphis domestica TaxID=13616 RepID=UPI0024E211C1|nr:BTB/POZ domain-containing protein 19 isoform X6 [Monodelphis domestica]